MITAVLDTNVLVQAVISSPRSPSARVLASYYDRRFLLVVSPGTLDEWIDVLVLPHIRARHGLSDDELLALLESLLANAAIYTGASVVPADLARDLTDTKFLALAQEANADYLVTNDREHLLRLRRHRATHIVTPAAFLRVLSGSEPRIDPPLTARE